MPVMAQKRRAAKREPSYEESALAAKQKQIAAEQAKLEAEMAKYKKLIDEAPKLAAERARRARDQFVIRASRTEHRGGNRAALPTHRRYDLDPGAPARQKRLRAERNKGRFMFFVLLLTFCGVMAWLYFSVLQHS
jgi:hypothetical protein